MLHRVIMTVGTSLVENKGGSEGAGANKVSCLNALCGKLKDQAEGSANVDAGLMVKIQHALLQLCAHDEIGHRHKAIKEQLKRSDRLPQELSYLYLLLSKHLDEGAKIEVFLLASDSKLGEACAEIVKGYLEAQMKNEKEPWCRICNVNMESISGLKAEGGAEFETTGAPALLGKIVELGQADHLEPGGLVIVNPTGGFKEAIPYATMAAALLTREYEMHYLFANADKITVLPPFPTGIDYSLWHREDALRIGATYWGGYRSKLDFRMRAVASQEATQARKVFEDAYRRLCDKDPFQAYSARVVEDLLPDDGAKYRERLLELIHRLGALIWLGDKLPMAASHAAEHHRNLLEVAQLILTPLLEAKPGFLNEHERFVLLAALLLHDCGHSLGALPQSGSERPVPLFPTEIRDLHHFLAFYRLTECGDDLGWDATQDLAMETAYLCAYHRRRSGWQTVENVPGKGSCPFRDWSLVPPLFAKDAYGLDARVDFPKLVALIRLIDGCDNQSRRVGPAPQADAMLKLMARDRSAHEAELRNAIEACQEYLKGGSGTDLRGVHFVYSMAEWLGGEASTPMPAFCWNDRYALAAPNQKDPVWAQLWTAAACARDEIALRDRQQPHFDKHQSVARVIIHPDADWCADSLWSLRVTLQEDPDFADILDRTDLSQDYKAAIADKPTLRAFVLDEVSSEIRSTDACQPAGYLAHAAGVPLRLTFGWDSEKHPVRRVLGGVDGTTMSE